LTDVFGPEVHALAVFDDGSGPVLWVGGDFMRAGGLTSPGVARWDGASWSAAGHGGFSEVKAFCAFDDGSGLSLYAAGALWIGSGATQTYGIVRWNGSGWSEVGGGLGGPERSANALAVFDDGSGPALYDGGAFSLAGGVPAARIARWDGSSWSALGAGVNSTVNALAVFNDGNGPALFAGGDFTVAGGVAANHVAKWRRSHWAPLGSGTSDPIFALRTFDDGGGAALYAGGSFGSAFDSGDSYLAKWGCSGP
jgi:hypothetical protein